MCSFSSLFYYANILSLSALPLPLFTAAENVKSTWLIAPSFIHFFRFALDARRFSPSRSTLDNKKEWALYYKIRPQFNVPISTQITGIVEIEWGKGEALENFWIMDLNKTYLIGRTESSLYTFFNIFPHLAPTILSFMAALRCSLLGKWEIYLIKKGLKELFSLARWSQLLSHFSDT